MGWTLPWETLFDGEEYLAAGAKTALSRLPLDVQPQKDLPAIPLPLKMLALVASPLDLKGNERLEIEREQEILLEAVNAPTGQGRLHLDFEDEAKLEILEESLEARYHILHFTGHGIPPADGGGLLLEDAQGDSRPTPVIEVLDSLQKGERILRLAVFSGCQTAYTLHIAGFHDLARGLIRRKIPAVIAMQFSISDRGGLRLTEALYPRLVAQQSLEIALSSARRALLKSDNPHLQADALAPVLLVANGQCLKTTEAESTPAPQPVLDLSFYLPLPQLGFGFYGRRREYRQIRDGLLRQNHRAVIVHGIGGIGKTALASHAATRLRRRFKGVYAFDCSGGTLAPEVIVRDLHRYFEYQGNKVLQPLVNQLLPPEFLANHLAQVLCQWPLLLLFDNFESQLERKDSIFQIRDENLRVFLTTLVKATATGSHFIFTSRYLFDLDARRLGTIQELPLGDLSRPEALSLMQKLPNLAVALFEDKLAAFETFGGHPYALVALDRHCSYKPVSQALKDAKSVHTELREFLALELNYACLSERGRALLDRLAAFRVPVPPEAAGWVIGEKVGFAEFLQGLNRDALSEELRALDEAALLDILERLLPEQRRQAEDLDRPIAELIGWGLLMPIREEEQPKSLAVHSLVRDFCRDRQRGETWRTCLRDAAAFYTNQTKLFAEYDKTLVVVEAEMEAFELLMEAENFGEAATLLVVAGPLLDRWGFGRYLEGQYLRLLDKVDRPMLAAIEHNLGVLLQAREEYGAALKEYEQSLKIEEDLGNRAGVASSLHQIGNLHYLRGQYEAALKKYEQSLKIKEDLGDRAGVASSLHQIGMIHQDRGEYEAALKKYEQSLKIKEDLGDRAGVASSLHQIGNLHYLRGEYEAVLKKYEQSLKIEEDLGNRAGMASSLHQIGMIHQNRGEYEAALKKYEQSLKIIEDLGDRAGVASSLHQIGIIHQDRGEYEAALKKYEQSLKIKEDLGNRAGVATSHGQIGKLLTQLDCCPEAFDHLFLALATFVELQSPYANLAVTELKNLRTQWGEQNFDAAWQQATGEVVPE